MTTTYLTRADLEHRLGISKATLTKRISSGELPAPHLFGRSQLFDSAAVEHHFQTLDPDLIAITPVKTPGIQELLQGAYACPARRGAFIGSRRPGYLVPAISGDQHPSVHPVIAVAHVAAHQIDQSWSSALSPVQRRLALRIAATPERAGDDPLTVFFLGDPVGALPLSQPPQQGRVQRLSRAAVSWTPVPTGT